MTKLSVFHRLWKKIAATGVCAVAAVWTSRAWAAVEQASAPTLLADNTVKAIAYMIIIASLLTVLFVGAFLVLNVGLMSKRDEDRTGGRNPSDVGVLKSTNWPQEAEVVRSLPAQEDDDTDAEDDDQSPPTHSFAYCLPATLSGAMAKDSKGNSFDRALNDRLIAEQWMSMIESDRSLVREADIYPMLRAWLDRRLPRKRLGNSAILDVLEVSAVLELGAGQGICSEQISLEGRHYTGVELSPILVKRATQLYAGVRRSFLEGSAYSLPIPEQSMDAVFSVAVWHLLEDLNKAAREMSRVMKPGASFWIVSANPGAYSEWTGLYTDTQTQGRRFEGQVKLPDGFVIHEVLFLHALDEITASLRAAGLEVQDVSTFREARAQKALRQFVAIEGCKSEGSNEMFLISR